MPTAYIQMIETAELVSQRYDISISRAAQDDYALAQPARTAAAQAAGLFDDEIVPAQRQQLFDKEGKPPAPRRVTLPRRGQPGRHHAGEPGGARRCEERQWVAQGRSSPPAMPRSCPTVPAPRC